MNPLPKGKVVGAVFVLVMFAVVFYAGYSYGIEKAPAYYKVAGLEHMQEGMPEAVDFSAFWQAWQIISEKYVPTRVSTTTEDNGIVGNQEKVWGAIEGLAGSLKDPYTVFFPPEEHKLFESEISGTFEGVGMEIGVKDGVLTVVAPLKDTPAYRAGIKAGDKIIMIDGVSSDGLSTDIAVRKIRGPRGTEVKLTIVREGRAEPFVLPVVRDVIVIPVIDTQVKLSDGTTSPDKKVGLRDDGVFVIKLYSFTAQSPNLFRDALREFVLSGSNKLLLDLRANPGGYLEAAVDMASWFLPAGKVVVKEEYAKDDVRIYRSKGYDIFSDTLRMVILVNEGSASASEILAGALREYDIAELVGTKTFGKGSVQELVSVTPETSLKVTVARWLTPSDKNISDEGLTPDHIVEVSPDDLSEGDDPQFDKALDVLLGL